MKRCNCSVLSQLRKDYHILFIRKTRYLFRERGLFHEKNMYSVLLHFFLFVCLVIPLHTTANAANTTDDCLQILTSDFDSDSAKEFIGTQHLNITDSQYQTIRAFTLDLTEKIFFHKG